MLDGTVTVVLDRAEVDLTAGDGGLVLRWSRPAWSNRGDGPAVVALTSPASRVRAGCPVSARIAVIPGDGVGQEVVPQGVRVLSGG